MEGNLVEGTQDDEIKEIRGDSRIHDIWLASWKRKRSLTLSYDKTDKEHIDLNIQTKVF